MKFKQIALASALAIFALAGCKKVIDYGDPSIKVDPNEIKVAVDGVSQALKFTATVDWKIEGYTSEVQNWISIHPLEGGPSKELQTINVTVSKNEGIERSATIKIVSTDGKLSASLKIIQGYFLPEIKSATVKEFQTAQTGYKYQRYKLTGVVKNLKSAPEGVFDLVDATGRISVSGLNATERAYGVADDNSFANIKLAERDEVTIVTYCADNAGKAATAYAYYVASTKYAEPGPESVPTVAYPYTHDFTASVEGFVVNNPVFPFAFESIWTAASDGYTASGNTGNTNYTVDSWLYSPKVDLKKAKKPVLVFNHIVRVFKNIEVAKLHTQLYVKEEGGNWKKTAIDFSYPDEPSSELVESESIDLAAYIGKKVQFAFRYTSDENSDAGLWTLKKLEVKEDVVADQPDNSSGTEDYNKPGWNWNK